ncbi:polysaccharide biosynthesis tyrosine autokinase [Jatrophihabitans sp.]|uniref:polysaccharide biosynthesis tyrosine autokinase n=1 Tax=Jatrophihabitans sp. TaxID=1932789 RepID=UPI0030C74161|nr:protein tyrosine kinase [Jatrophihabitans sp.]
MNLRSYLRVLRERWKLVLFFLVASIGVAVVVTVESPKVYTASVQVFVQPTSSVTSQTQYTGVVAGQALVTTYASLATTPDIIQAVKNDLHLEITDSALRGKITASAPLAQSLVVLSVTDRSPNRAAAIANSAGRSFTTVIEKFSEDNNHLPTVKLFVTQPATAPSSPTSPNTILNIGIGFVLGLLIGAALAVARDIVDNRIKDPDELSKVAGAPMMGIVVDDPKTPRHPIATRAGNRNVRAENYRQLRANLQFANVDHHPRVIAVTSSVPTEGKTTVAINLASTLAEAGFSVCLVDADLRRPTVAKVLGLLSPVGLTSVLIHQIELGEVLQHAGSSMYVLTSGPTPPNPSEVLASSYVRDVIRSLLDKVDYVVIDTAPLLPVADGSEVAALADGTLLVARHGLTTDNNIKRATATLARVDAKLLGVVLNRMPLKRNRNEYGYTYYRETDAPTHSRSERRKAKKS